MPDRMEYVYAHCISGYHDVIAAITTELGRLPVTPPELQVALATARFIRDTLIEYWGAQMGLPFPNSEVQRDLIVQAVRQWLTDNLAEYMAIIDGEPSEVL